MRKYHTGDNYYYYYRNFTYSFGIFYKEKSSKENERKQENVSQSPEGKPGTELRFPEFLKPLSLVLYLLSEPRSSNYTDSGSYTPLPSFFFLISVLFNTVFNDLFTKVYFPFVQNH